MHRRFGKKGYYFVIDAIIGGTIIFLSLMIILNNGVKPTKIQYQYEMAEEYSNFILNTKISEISNPYVNQLEDDGNITNTDLTIMEQVDLFYYNNKSKPQAEGVIRNLTESLVPVKYGFTYNIIDGANITNIYNRTTPSIDGAKIVVSSRKITFLQINSSTMFGPAIVEIKIWV